MTATVEVHGEIPNIVGAKCEGVLSQGLIYGIEVVQDSVLFIKANDAWHRLAIDNGVVFWRQQDDEPRSWSIPADGFHFPVRDVAVVAGMQGLRFESLSQAQSGSTTFVELTFSAGRVIRFSERGGQTTLELR